MISSRLQQPAQRNDQQQYDGEAGQQGAEDEERRKFGGMPADGGGAGKIQTDDAVHRHTSGAMIAASTP